ncbi:2,3-dihydro-2,3-dihydroxybenzoate dehydrogenase [Prauserella cavernicola]|uniref:2,3-dihydro-2,3-dihydroxybenzoate dehydrogenase n=1 Tax=Prauserella cavernicola TaxID=2800127 RepID=A0A934QMG2_9PSEU|nr:2,3-dihydro-2,3-dihydroxybenzoate dehydrogenase [Prauserella cavernicola]MBK1783171.1 2,3-dihydro-2,3-dihydroxybenzoate dehydrogenase [Prauserella cavernicola]
MAAVREGETGAVVTGAAQGIGAATALAFAERGLWVAAVDRDIERLGGVVADFGERGLDVRAFPADLTDPGAADAVVAEVEQACGPIGSLVNCAGVLRTGPVTELSDDDWAALFAVNATGVFSMSRAVARRMVPRGSGSIVTVSSNAGGVPRAGMAGYAASKAAATMFTKSLGLELAGHGIRCNVVAPGSTDTPMLRGMWPDGADEAESAERVIAGSPADFKIGIPLGRLARPHDVAEAIVFLCSPGAGHITLQELYVDGGAALGG